MMQLRTGHKLYPMRLTRLTPKKGPSLLGMTAFSSSTFRLIARQTFNEIVSERSEGPLRAPVRYGQSP